MRKMVVFQSIISLAKNHPIPPDFFWLPKSCDLPLSKMVQHVPVGSRKPEMAQPEVPILEMRILWTESGFYFFIFSGTPSGAPVPNFIDIGSLLGSFMPTAITKKWQKWSFFKASFRALKIIRFRISFFCLKGLIFLFPKWCSTSP